MCSYIQPSNRYLRGVCLVLNPVPGAWGVLKVEKATQETVPLVASREGAMWLGDWGGREIFHRK